jgi:hypothetical protein
MAAQLRILLFILSFSVSAKALDVRDSQFHFRTGMLNGKYSGTFEGDFSVTAALDMEFEFFVLSNGAVPFRFIQAMDSPDSRPFYTYAGSGYRYYWRSRGMYSFQKMEGVMIEALPRYRMYLGAEAGVAQVLVKSFGPNVQSVANMFEVGVNVGAIYQITRKLGVEGQAGTTFGYGVSSTPTNGSTVRALIGASYFF